MRKIAILTLYDNSNIGNKLQNYAVQIIFEKLGYICTTITYKEIFKEISWKGWIVYFLGIPQGKAKYKRMLVRRKQVFADFSNRYLNIEKPIHFRDISKIVNRFDYFVTGSDQVWHNWTNTKEELAYFFLEFAPEEKRICIAPSFGFEHIPEEFRNNYQKGLQGFRNLSCREISGCKMIFELTGRDAELLIDPTMVLTIDDWNKICVKPKYEVPDKYLLIYFLGGMNPEDVNYINKLAKRQGLKIINIFSLDDEIYYYTSPNEFLYLIKNASYVCTNSFHGCTFSILYNINFLVFNRMDAEGSKMHSRIGTLLSKFGLENYVVKGKEDFNFASIDFSTTNTILKEERKKEIAFLEKSIQE